VLYLELVVCPAEHPQCKIAIVVATGNDDASGGGAMPGHVTGAVISRAGHTAAVVDHEYGQVRPDEHGARTRSHSRTALKRSLDLPPHSALV